MPINNNTLICFDFETTGKDPLVCWPVEIAGKAYDARSLEPIKDGEFHSMCKPPDDVIIEQEALDVTGIKRGDIAAAPSIEVVYPSFIRFVERFNRKKNKWEAPVPIGQNIKGFDLKIHSRMLEKFGSKGADSICFNTFKQTDLLDILFMWFENSNELPKFNMDTLRPYFGIETKTAHRALTDVRITGAIITRFLKFHRTMMANNPVRFKDAFKGISFDE